ncbi:hypothetical protein MNBD_CHLOROFLEXI01-742 [hydrothermal vent metagenome]|uniref:Uncharacterized protein n=1 Tax=hydrothermal vent metagenome TaxID=652676 RepID=A0A3B0V168_9ZZZZ
MAGSMAVILLSEFRLEVSGREVFSISRVDAGGSNRVRVEKIRVPEGIVTIEVIEHGEAEITLNGLRDAQASFCGQYNEDTVTLNQYCSSGAVFVYTSCPLHSSGFNTHTIEYDNSWYQNSQSCGSNCTITVTTSWGANYKTGKAYSYNSLVDAKFMVCQ